MISALTITCRPVPSSRGAGNFAHGYPLRESNTALVQCAHAAGRQQN
jgi:hypothetical protein